MSVEYRSLAYYLRESAGLTSSHFLSGFDHSVLLWSQSLDWVRADDFQFTTVIIDSGKQTPLKGLARTQSQAAETSVIEVRKRRGATTSKIILVGRAVNNDIVFNDVAISKLHAFFQKSAHKDSYEIIDAGSTNGTKVNRELLTPHQAQPLANRDQIQFGPNIQVMYFTAMGFYNFLQQLHRLGIT